jgi:hypothetical protein
MPSATCCRDLAGCLDIESYTARIRVYELETVPSLLQLGQYAEVVRGWRAGTGDPATWMSVRLQQARLEMVKERAVAGTSFDFVIGENVLVRPVGGPRLMADQLRKISEVGELSNVSADSRELIAELAWMFSRQARQGRVLSLVPLV